MTFQIKAHDKKGGFCNYVLEIENKNVIVVYYGYGYSKNEKCKKDIDFEILTSMTECNKILKQHFVNFDEIIK